MRRVALQLVLLVLCVAVWAADPPTVTVQQHPSPAIALDGRLNEPVWRDAPVLKLTQQSPKPGEPTQFDTEVRVIVAADRLYFGFACHDPQPKRIAIHTMQRDGDTNGDDSVSIVLDTYGDRRTGYFFRINAAGARTDGLIANAESASL